MLKVREFTGATGLLSAVYLRHAGGALELVREIAGRTDVTTLPARALAAVMSRYGAAFDPDAPISVVAALDLGPGVTLRHVRHIAGYDVIGRDYLVYEVDGAETLCVLAASVARALEHLADAVRARRTADRSP